MPDLSAYNICLGVGHPDNIDYDTPAATAAAGAAAKALAVAADDILGVVVTQEDTAQELTNFTVEMDIDT